jgi:hypothetical protein
MQWGFVMVHEPLPSAVGQEKLPPGLRPSRTALPPEAHWFCGQAYAKGPASGSPAKMNLTNCKSD